MKVKLWGTRGSLASPGPDTVRYGGNTSCVAIYDEQDIPIILDAGTGIRGLGLSISPEFKSFHILLTHLHMDHLQGLPFFTHLYRPGVENHIYGPASLMHNLGARLHRYLSPPLFPVRTRDLLSEFHFHELPKGKIEIGEFLVRAQMILHPNPTVGYRIEHRDKVVTYIPDHEPVLGVAEFPTRGEWLSGYRLAEGADILIHDAQFTDEEYVTRYGFGHSSLTQATRFALLADVRQFVPFHHDPAHSDDFIDAMMERMMVDLQPSIPVTPGKEGTVFDVT
jgi:phosphoribosyl 1,2-cyclic phosphodiesterase